MDTTTEYRFWGEFEHAVDDKGRVIIPQDFRGPLGEEFVVTRGTDRAIMVLPLPVWLRFEQTLNSSVMQRETAYLQRLFGSRTFVKLDPQYRLGIPKHLRDHAGISQSQSAVIIGQGSKLEIWSKPAWDDYCANFTSENVFQAAETIGLADVLSK